MLILLTILTVITRSLSNPYRVLGVAPYYSKKRISEIYEARMLENHPSLFDGEKDSRKNFDILKRAYYEIMLEREDDDNTVSYGIFFSIKKCISSILFWCFVIVVFYCVVNIIYKIIAVSWRFITFVLFFFLVVEYYFAHWFDQELSQLIFCLIFSFFLESMLVIKEKYYKNDSEEKKLEKEN